jgi:hypothetical protein
VTAVRPPAPNEPPPPARGQTREERGRDVSAAQGEVEAESSKVKQYLKAANPRFLWSMADGYPVVLKQFIQFCLIIIYPAWIFFVICAAAQPRGVRRVAEEEVAARWDSSAARAFALMSHRRWSGRARR